MADKLVDILLAVKIENGAMVAHLQFSNVTSKKVHLDEQTICFYKKTYDDLFLIKDEKGRIIDYAGAKVKRDIDPEYFQHLNPGEKIETSVNLSEVYEVKKGEKYTIQYSTYHPDYLHEQEFTEIESNPVEIVYS